MIGNKTADKITSTGKSKGKNKESRRNLHSNKKKHKILMTLKCFEHKIRNKAVAFKNDAPFINCASKISGVKIDDAEDLDVVMLMYNLLEYSKNYKKTTGSLWNYYRDERSDPLSSSFKSFKYKTSTTGNTYNVGDSEAGYDTKLAKIRLKLLHH